MEEKNNIVIVEQRFANAITHSGIFHADEVFATVLLLKVFCNLLISRVLKVTETVLPNAIVYDVGGGQYDHHQKGFDKQRENGIKYSSFGLLWQKFGRQMLEKIGIENHELLEMVFVMFDENLVAGIDAVDNGQTAKSSVPPIVKTMSLSSIISSFNPTWNENTNPDECFLKAVNFAETIFDNILKNTISKAKAKVGVEVAIEKSVNGIMVFDQFMPWQDFIFKTTNPKAKDILYVIFPSTRGGYNVVAVPAVRGNFEKRKSLPKEWAGLRGSEFAKVSGVQTATFCHLARFICSADTFEDAMLLAKKAVESE